MVKVIAEKLNVVACDNCLIDHEVERSTACSKKRHMSIPIASMSAKHMVNIFYVKLNLF